jgi:hypothetical protein
MATLTVSPDEQRPLLLPQEEVKSVPGHPHYTFDFPGQDEYSPDEAHQRLCATLWKLYDRASFDARTDHRDPNYPPNAWKEPLATHARAVMAWESSLNTDPLTKGKHLSNHLSRFRFFYGVFYLASYLRLLELQPVTEEQRAFLNQQKQTVLTDIPTDSAEDRELARQLIAQIPGYEFLQAVEAHS